MNSNSSIMLTMAIFGLTWGKELHDEVSQQNGSSTGIGSLKTANDNINGECEGIMTGEDKLQCKELDAAFLISMLEYEDVGKLILFHDEIPFHSLVNIMKYMSKKYVLTRTYKLTNESIDKLQNDDFMEQALYIVLGDETAVRFLEKVSNLNAFNGTEEESKMWLLFTNKIYEIIQKIKIGANGRVIYVKKIPSQECIMEEDKLIELYALRYNFFKEKTQMILNGVWSTTNNLMMKNTARLCCLDIAGAKLKIIAMNQPPWIMVKENSEGKYNYSGILIDVMEALSRSLNIKYELTYEKENIYGSVQNSDSSWTGIVGKLQQKKADIGLMLMKMSFEKSEALDFSPALVYDGPIFMIPKQKNNFNYTGYILPFGINVWLFSLLIHITISIGLIASSEKISIVKSKLWEIISHIILQEQAEWVDGLPLMTSGRIFFITNAFFILLMTQMYNSIVISYLTVSRPQPPFKDIQGLINSEYRWIVQSGSDMEKIMDDYYQPGTNRDKLEEKKVQVSTPTEALELLNRYSNVAFLSLQHEMQYLTRDTCNYSQLNIFNDKDLVYLRLIYAKDCSYQVPINNQLVKMAEGGIIQRLIKNYTISQRSCQKDDGLTPFTLSQIKLPFVIWLVGTGLSGAICISEVAYKKIKKCKTEQKEWAKHVEYEIRNTVSNTLKINKMDVSMTHKI